MLRWATEGIMTERRERAKTERWRDIMLGLGLGENGMG